MDNDQERPGKSSLKEEIISLIKHDDVEILFKRYLNNAKKIHRTKVVTNSIVVLLGFLIGIGAFYLAYESSANETKVATIKAYDAERASSIRAGIERKIQWMEKINSSIINMRTIRYNIVLGCKNKKPISSFKQNLLRSNARFNVILSSTGNQYVFNDALNTKIHDLLVFDENVVDVCSKSAPGDAKWRQYLQEINDIMGDSIRDEQNRLKEIDS